MKNPYRCENADQCPQECDAKRHHSLATHCASKMCQLGVFSKCVPVNPPPTIDDEVQQGSRQFRVELGDLVIRAENCVEATEKAARWIAAHAATSTYMVGDMAELNDPILPFMSRALVSLTDGKGSVVM